MKYDCSGRQRVKDYSLTSLQPLSGLLYIRFDKHAGGFFFIKAKQKHEKGKGNILLRYKVSQNCIL